MNLSYRCALPTVVVACGLLGACGDDPPAAAEEAREAAVGVVHGAACKAMHASIEENDGHDVPTDAGQPRLAMPDGAPERVRVRRSYSTLDAGEKQRLADAFLALKQTPYEYDSMCDALDLTAYPKNLYDYFVEAHVSAFVSMKTPYMSHAQMPHMGPQFTAWHRYYLLRLELELGRVLGDPDFALPYWDWNDCGARSADDPDANPCPAIFDHAYLGSAGTCDDATVHGALVDGGFESHIFTSPGLDVFRTSSISCGSRPLQRQVGCSDVAALPAQGSQVTDIFARTVFDAEPYDSCDTDQEVSFRQYLEGFTDADVNPLCITGGCQMHGQGHYYIGGDMGSGAGTPNDPVFFLHHANIDRLWAEWQANNLAEGRSADHGNPGFPDDWRGPLFIWNEVEAEEMFDHRALGFTYDTLRAGG